MFLVVDSNPDSLKTKKSELRLYCDLLMQQVHMIKTAVSNDKEPDLQVSIVITDFLTLYRMFETLLQFKTMKSGLHTP